MKKHLSILLMLAGLMAIAALPSCEYHNGDDQTQSGNKPEPEPEPEPEPQPEEFLAALKTPNCFMVAPGTAVEFTILKAYAIWSVFHEEFGDYILKGKTPAASLLWQDEPGLITDISMDATDKEFALLRITTSRKHGNAVVAVTIDGAIRWSWHIWVTDYDPDKWVQGRTYNWDNDGDGVTDFVLMDRNLGAASDGTLLTPADSLAAMGLYYQFGRKDPFPQDPAAEFYSVPSSRPIYNFDGARLASIAEHNDEGMRVEVTTVVSNLAKAIHNPLTLYTGKHIIDDKFSYFTKDKLNDELWEKEGVKMAFDPCPEGWQVPPVRNYIRYSWGIWTEYWLDGFQPVTPQYCPLGVLPYNGQISFNTGDGSTSGHFMGGRYCVLHSATPLPYNPYIHMMAQYIVIQDGKLKQAPVLSATPRSCAVGIRCARVGGKITIRDVQDE